MRLRGSPAVLATVLLVGCTAGPDYRPPATVLPGSFAEAGGVPSGPPVAAWWTTFHDAVLDSLIRRGIVANPDLRAARARVREARARSGLAAEEAVPAVDATGGASRSRTGSGSSGMPGRTSNLYEAGFDATWEIDLYGGVGREGEAAGADLAASVEDRRDVLVSLAAEIARDYLDLRGAQRQAAIARENLASQEQTLDLTRKRLEAGLADALDVARAEANARTTAAAIPALESDARRSIHALGVLLALPPGALVPELEGDAPIPAAPPGVPAGLPSELLLRRPDIRRAERRLAAATARIGAATADLYPRFSLTGALGLSSDDLGNLVDAGSRTGSIGGAVRWPILDFGRVRDAIEIRGALEEQAADAYESAVLTGLREVEDALVTLAKERAGRVPLAGAVDASRMAADIADQLWRAGRTDFLAVLDSQRVLFAARDALARSDRRIGEDVVALYKALGGGWDMEPIAAPSPPRGEPGRRSLDLDRPASGPGAR